jgi:electron transport complex protein RnfG
MRDILKLVITLTTISIVAAFSLAFVYDVTKEPIAQSLREEKLAAIRAVLPEYDNAPDQQVQSIGLGRDQRGREQKLEFYVATRQGEWVGTAFTSSGKGFGGEIVLMLGITPNKQINRVKVLNHKETPGLGAKVAQAKFIDQFNGRPISAEELKVKKDGGDIDAVTGATISSRAVTAAINEGLKVYTERFEPPVNKVGQ